MTKKQALLTPQHDLSIKDRFCEINGKHRYKDRVPEGRVEYRVAYRPGGEVYFFNFELAQEMGLIPTGIPKVMSAELEEIVLQTFSLQVINEHDVIHGHKFSPKDIRLQTYMATRYLQLQHSCRKGTTSGDGRSIWNGEFISQHRGWDISSCGTGATRLSPATHSKQKFFQTGDPSISYGCGLADLEDGVCAAVLSEIFHRQAIPTERTLALISFPNGLSINVRAHPNLFRPSHFFGLVRQKKQLALKEALGLYLQREILNKKFESSKRSAPLDDPHWAQKFLEIQSERFAKMAARFERDYIFCWLDWDGDNILMDGGIIDYGSIRQFGLFHHQYRYDDIERWSTNILQQKAKAKMLVAAFVQMVEFIQSGKIRPLNSFTGHWACQKFEKDFIEAKHIYLLNQWGASELESKWLWRMHNGLCQKLYKSAHYFERRLTAAGVCPTPDGENKSAIYSIRALMSDLPLHLGLGQEIDHVLFKSLMWAGSGNRQDFLTWSANDHRQFSNYTTAHKRIVELLSSQNGCSEIDVNIELYTKNSSWPKQGRMTGDSLIYVIDALMKQTKKHSFEVRDLMIKSLVEMQTNGHMPPRVYSRWGHFFDKIKKILTENLNGL